VIIWSAKDKSGGADLAINLIDASLDKSKTNTYLFCGK
jgi:hypothetical protein